MNFKIFDSECVVTKYVGEYNDNGIFELIVKSIKENRHYVVQVNKVGEVLGYMTID